MSGKEEPLACVRRSRVENAVRADDTGVVNNSTEGLAKTVTIIVTVFEPTTGLTVFSETNVEAMVLQAPDGATSAGRNVSDSTARHRSNAGEKNIQTIPC